MFSMVTLDASRAKTWHELCTPCAVAALSLVYGEVGLRSVPCTAFFMKSLPGDRKCIAQTMRSGSAGGSSTRTSLVFCSHYVLPVLFLKDLLLQVLEELTKD